MIFIKRQVGSLYLAGAARDHTPMLAIYLVIFTAGIEYNGTHISDTRTIRWVIYYVQRRSGRMLYARRRKSAHLQA